MPLSPRLHQTSSHGEGTPVKTQEVIAIESVSTIATTDFSVPATDESLPNLVEGEKVQEATPRQDPPPIPQLLSQYHVPPCISYHMATLSINLVCDFGIDTSDAVRSRAPLVSVLAKLHPTTMALPSPPPLSFLDEPGINNDVVVAKTERQDVNGVFAIKSAVGSSTHPGGCIFVFDPGGPLAVLFPPSRITSKLEVSAASPPLFSTPSGAPPSAAFSSSSARSGASPVMAPLSAVPPPSGSASGWPWVPWSLAIQGSIRVCTLDILLLGLLSFRHKFFFF